MENKDDCCGWGRRIERSRPVSGAGVGAWRNAVEGGGCWLEGSGGVSALFIVVWMVDLVQDWCVVGCSCGVSALFVLCEWRLMCCCLWFVCLKGLGLSAWRTKEARETWFCSLGTAAVQSVTISGDLPGPLESWQGNGTAVFASSGVDVVMPLSEREAELRHCARPQWRRRRHCCRGSLCWRLPDVTAAWATEPW